MTPRMWLAVTLAASAALAGCTDESVRPKPRAASLEPVAEVDAINVEMPPYAGVDLDGKGGPEAIQVRLTFWRRDPAHPLAVAVTGTVEVRLYDGPPDCVGQAEPFVIMALSGPRLAAIQARSVFGVAYPTIVPFGDRRPKHSTITLVVCYTPPGGGLSVLSKPTGMVLGPS